MSAKKIVKKRLLSRRMRRNAKDHDKNVEKVFLVTERLILCLAAEVRSRQLWMGANAAQVWQESMLRINHHSLSSHVFN